MKTAVALFFLFGIACLNAQTTDAPETTKPAQKHARKVYTNDDLEPSGGRRDKPEERVAKAQVAKAQEEKPQPEKSVEKDQQARQAMKARVEVLKTEEATLTEKLERLKEKAANETSDFRKKMWEESYSRQQITLQQWRDERASLEQQLAKKDAAPEGKASPATGQSQ